MEPLELGAESLQDLLRSEPSGVAVIESPGRFVWANPAYFAVTGRSPAMIGMDVHQILEEDGSWSAPIRDAVDAALRDGQSTRFPSVRARYRAQSGGVFLDVDVLGVPPADGRPARAVLYVRDVTDRVEQLERARLFYESFRSSTNPMQLTDAEGRMVDVNPAFEKVYGFTRQECIGRKPNLVRSRHTPSEVYQEMWQSLLDPNRGYWSGEVLNRDRMGRERPVILSITAIRAVDGRVTHYLGVAVDLSEQRSWELRAAHGDRLASVGQLAAGVAHEINTPLANIMLVAESIKRRSSDAWVQKRIETLTQQVDLAAGIVRGLLDFARRDEPKVAALDLSAVVRDAIEFVEGKQPADVEIVAELPNEPLQVLGDRGQLIQVFTNLLNNASDAMEGRGTVRIVGRRVGRRVQVEVVDSGPGVPTEVLPHIFDPFFTTKPEGEGTGLGLAICHGILQSHHGTISVRNVPGAGAGFLISLPDLSADPVPRPSGNSRAAGA